MYHLSIPYVHYILCILIYLLVVPRPPRSLSLPSCSVRMLQKVKLCYKVTNFVTTSCTFCYKFSLINRRFPSFLSPLFQSESKCEAFHMETSSIHTQSLVHLHVNKTHLKQRRKATRKSPIDEGDKYHIYNLVQGQVEL